MFNKIKNILSFSEKYNSYIDFSNYNNEFINEFKLLLEKKKENENIYLKELQTNYNLDRLKIIKLLYFNQKSIHKLLLEQDMPDIQIIMDEKIQSLSFNFYLSLLIRQNSTFNYYNYSLEYIQELYEKQKTNNENKYNKIIISKMMHDLIEYYKHLDEYWDYQNEVDTLENEINNIINENINIFNELDINWNIKEIKQKNIDEIYSNIIEALIKKIKYIDFEYILNIINQLDLENIDIIKIIFDKKYKLINIERNLINEYLILEEDDISNENKINFYYFILKFILRNNSLFLYKIDFLLKTKKLFVRLIKSNSKILFSLNIKYMERFEYLLDIIIDSKYYLNLYNRTKIDKNIKNINHIQTDNNRKAQIKYKKNKLNIELSESENIIINNLIQNSENHENTNSNNYKTTETN